MYVWSWGNKKKGKKRRIVVNKKKIYIASVRAKERERQK